MKLITWDFFTEMGIWKICHHTGKKNWPCLSWTKINVSLGRKKENKQSSNLLAPASLPQNRIRALKYRHYCHYCHKVQSSARLHWRHSSTQQIYVYICLPPQQTHRLVLQICWQPELDASEGYSRLQRKQTQDTFL